MQLLRDNLTLWTSSDSGEAEVAPTAEAPKDEKAADHGDVKAETAEPSGEPVPAADS